MDAPTVPLTVIVGCSKYVPPLTFNTSPARNLLTAAVIVFHGFVSDPLFVSKPKGETTYVAANAGLLLKEKHKKNKNNTKRTFLFTTFRLLIVASKNKLAE